MKVAHLLLLSLLVVFIWVYVVFVLSIRLCDEWGIYCCLLWFAFFCHTVILLSVESGSDNILLIR